MKMCSKAGLGRLLAGIVMASAIAILAACDGGHEDDLVDLQDTVPDTALQKKHVHHSHEGQHVFYFGFDLRASPQEDARQYLPFLKYLNEKTGYEFRLRFTPKSSSIVEELGKGRIHFAAVGADSYISAHEKYGVIGLVRGVNKQGKAEYQSKIVVAPGSAIKTLAELKGKRLAFGSFTSTQGHLIPRIIIEEHGMKLVDFSGYTYTGSHQNCVNAVVAGRVDACGMQDTMADTMVEQGLVRVLYASRYYPSSGIAAHADLQHEVIARVKQALLDFKPTGRDKNSLYHWDRTEMPNGFVDSNDTDYDELRKWINYFGLLESSKR